MELLIRGTFLHLPSSRSRSSVTVPVAALPLPVPPSIPLKSSAPLLSSPLPLKPIAPLLSSPVLEISKLGTNKSAPPTACPFHRINKGGRSSGRGIKVLEEAKSIDNRLYLRYSAFLETVPRAGVLGEDDTGEVIVAQVLFAAGTPGTC